MVEACAYSYHQRLLGIGAFGEFGELCMHGRPYK